MRVVSSAAMLDVSAGASGFGHAADERPLVSVVVRTKDRPGLLREALESVAAQSYTNVEAVVVNDGGGSVQDVFEGFSERLAVRATDLIPGKGRSAAANAGLSAATGKWVFFLDDDDLLAPDGISALVAAADGADAVVYGRVEAWSYEGQGLERTRRLFRVFGRPYTAEGMLFENYIPLCASLFPADILRRAGGIDESLDRFEDWDLYLRLSDLVPFRFVDALVAEYRLFGSSFIDDPGAAAAQHEWRVAILRKHAHRYTPEALSRVLGFLKADYVPREFAAEADRIARRTAEVEAAREAADAARLAAERLAAVAEAARVATELRAAQREASLVSVVIVNYNGKHHLERCLPSLLRPGETPGEVILVDNGSRDGSVEWVRKHYPTVDVVPYADNLGFGEANRRGILKARGPFVVLLNSDTDVQPGWLGPLIRPLREDSEIAASCSTLRLMAYPEVLNASGGGMSRLGYGFDHHFCLPDVPADELGDQRPWKDVLFPTAAAMAMKKQDFVELGGFDRSFFMYHEDVDLGWRLWILGRRVVVCRDSVVHHAFLGTSKAEKGLEWRARLGLRHSIRSHLKHYELVPLLKVARWHIKTLVRMRAWNHIARLTAWNLAHLGGTLVERARIQRRRVRSTADLTRLGLISPVLYPAPSPEVPRYRGTEPASTWIASPTLAPALFSGESRLGFGWYSPEWSGAAPFRWTCGSARCVLRVAPRARGVLSVELTAPAGATAGEIVVTTNGREARVPLDGQAWQTVKTPVEADADGLLDIRLVSPSAVPHEAIRNWDFRRLGSGVRSVRFAASETASAAPRKLDRVSVVIPTYNRWPILEENLEALRRQTHRDFETIVVDDGSTDGTFERLTRWQAAHGAEIGLTALRQENLRQGRARNLGVSHANGDLVLFFGDDTLPEPECLAEHVAAHRAAAAPCAIIGFTDWHREKMRVTPFLEYINGQGPQFSFDLLHDGQEVPFTNFYTSNISLPREIAAANLFDPAFTSYGWEDLELGWRLSQQGLPIVYRQGARTRHVHPMTVRTFMDRQRHVGVAIAALYRVQPRLEGNPFLPPRHPRRRYRALNPFFAAAAPLLHALDQAGVRLPNRLYHECLSWAFYAEAGG